MTEPTPRYWFPTKKYGWGWGPPRTWQGWAVLIAFMLLLGAGSVVLSPAASPIKYALYVAVLSTALIGVCYAKGEPPKWRWGR